MYINNSIQPGVTLSERYIIVRQIGQGGFGRTYLAEDINRFRELCVLKEFSPQVQTDYVVEKAEELFKREASVLYKLQHPQIPSFRELLRINLQGKQYLFLVQDYVEGKTYSHISNARQQQGLRFTESEIRQLLLQILPVVDYIHSMGVIHRDISPDNLILRTSDQLPVLIDFGGVKQVAATVASEYYQADKQTSSPSPTLLGKVGFAPPEQMQTGLVSTHSDLYALAVTMLVLLTGKQPQELINHDNLTWQWRRETSLTPAFGQVLDKMLSPRPSDRYQSARQVLQALNPPQFSYSPTQYPTTSEPTSATLAVSPSLPSSPSPPSLQPTTWWTAVKVFVSVLVLATAAGGVFWVVTDDDGDLEKVAPTPSPTPTVKDPTDSSAEFSLAERQRKLRLNNRREQLGIDSSFYVSLVNQIFWQNNPSSQRENLSAEPKDESLRAEWDETAAQLLEKLAPLSTSARRQLGTYTVAEREAWRVEVNKINVSTTSLYDLADTAFFNEFPQQQGKNFINQPIGQVWHGFVSDKLNALRSRTALAKITFDSGATSKTVNGNLQPAAHPAGGKVFIANLAQNQLMEVRLKASSPILLSVYSPSGKVKFLEDSTERNLSVKLPESGFYEFVLASTASEPLSYQLTISAETPTPEPTPTAEPTPTPEPTPIESPTLGDTQSN
ncbi:serine/threonine protein kinase [Chrysosporum ovalisporum ANA283AFssAo]|uniref:serine/threonine-protein kinase n=1 Tax=Umezakia ovalisporum TaxID=75695 RepID=UPI002472F25E|nr:serine/threonine-protein kinase [Umezakia ovalisporum]MDH6078415.1 serine/threonine protein kinase [Umezakia ovalisporum FSS-45]MDH6101378.1 serine/threonine protein kinase [Umezakia ovalisporum ANA283AFssAo]